MAPTWKWKEREKGRRRGGGKPGPGDGKSVAVVEVPEDDKGRPLPTELDEHGCLMIKASRAKSTQSRQP